jgi:hypothetical protein
MTRGASRPYIQPLSFLGKLILRARAVRAATCPIWLDMPPPTRGCGFLLSHNNRKSPIMIVLSRAGRDFGQPGPVTPWPRGRGGPSTPAELRLSHLLPRMSPEVPVDWDSTHHWPPLMSGLQNEETIQDRRQRLSSTPKAVRYLILLQCLMRRHPTWQLMTFSAV